MLNRFKPTTTLLLNVFGKRPVTNAFSTNAIHTPATPQVPVKEKAVPKQDGKAQSQKAEPMTETQKALELARSLSFPWQTNPSPKTSTPDAGAPQTPQYRH